MSTKAKKFAITIAGAFIKPFTVGILADWKAKENPVTGKPSLTNFPTCLCGNTDRSFEVKYIVDGQVKLVKGEKFAPARDLATGVYDRAKSRYIMGKYSRGQFSNLSSATKEFWLVMSYFIACITRSTLPSPGKRSISSTIMTQFVDYWLNLYKIKVESVKVKGDHGLSLTHSPKSLDSIMSIFRNNAEDIMQTWPNRQTRISKDDGILI